MTIEINFHLMFFLKPHFVPCTHYTVQTVTKKKMPLTLGDYCCFLLMFLKPGIIYLIDFQ